MSLSITPLYGGLIGLLLVSLSVRVILRRRSAHVSLGDGEDKNLLKRMRVQANCAEYAPIGLILLAMAELQGAPGWVVHLLGLMLLGGTADPRLRAGINTAGNADAAAGHVADLSDADPHSPGKCRPCYKLRYAL